MDAEPVKILNDHHVNTAALKTVNDLIGIFVQDGSMVGGLQFAAFERQPIDTEQRTQLQACVQQVYAPQRDNSDGERARDPQQPVQEPSRLDPGQLFCCGNVQSQRCQNEGAIAERFPPYLHARRLVDPLKAGFGKCLRRNGVK